MKRSVKLYLWAIGILLLAVACIPAAFDGDPIARYLFLTLTIIGYGFTLWGYVVEKKNRSRS